jgi:hypothetical protein
MFCFRRENIFSRTIISFKKKCWDTTKFAEIIRSYITDYRTLLRSGCQLPSSINQDLWSKHPNRLDSRQLNRNNTHKIIIIIIIIIRYKLTGPREAAIGNTEYITLYPSVLRPSHCIAYHPLLTIRYPQDPYQIRHIKIK